MITPKESMNPSTRLYLKAIEYGTEDLQQIDKIDKLIAKALEAQKKEIVDEMLGWTNKNYRRSTLPLYAWVDALDLSEKLKLIITNK